MKLSINTWQFIGYSFTSLVGTLLHFLYEWTNRNAFASFFSGVNESTWEHMKLLFFPMLIFAIIESFIFRERKDFWCVKLKGILLGIITIPIIFYLYNGIIGNSPDYINIAIFFISGAVTYIYESRLFKKGTCSISQKTSICVLCIITLAFMIFTYLTPRLEIFKDPLSGIYGIDLKKRLSSVESELSLF